MSSLSGISLFAQNSGYFSMVGQRHEETNPSLGVPYIFLTLVIQGMNREVTVTFPYELNARVQRDFGNIFQAKLIYSLFRKYIWGILSTEAFQERLRGLYTLSNDTAPELSVGHLLGDSTSRKKILLEDLLEKIPGLRTTWFHQACKSGDRVLVRLMLEFLSELNHNHVDIRNEDGCTALMVAIEHDRYEVAELLLAAKADPNACDAKGITSLHRAASVGSFDLVELLLDNGAEITKDEKGWTPFYYLIKKSEKEEVESICKLLVSAGDDVHAEFITSDGSTYNLINLAVSCKSNALPFLLERNVNVNFLLFGNTALDDLISYHSQSVRYTLFRRIDPALTGRSGNTSLHHACKEYHLRRELVGIIEKLVEDDNTRLFVKNREGRLPIDLLVAGAIERNRNLLSFVSLYLLFTAAQIAGGITGKNYMPAKKEVVDDKNDKYFLQLMRIFKNKGTEASLQTVISLYRFKLKYFSNRTLDDLYAEFYFSFLMSSLKCFIYLGITKGYSLVFRGCAVLFYVVNRIFVNNKFEAVKTSSQQEIEAYD